MDEWEKGSLVAEREITTDKQLDFILIKFMCFIKTFPVIVFQALSDRYKRKCCHSIYDSPEEFSYLESLFEFICCI